MKPSIHEFRWVEMVNDSKGKTSTGKFLALIGGIVSVLTFGVTSVIALIIAFGSNGSHLEASNLAQNIAMQSVALFTLCIAHLTTRRFSNDKELEKQPEGFGVTGIGEH
jgi:hypothetical protein